jgi:hypothetical protein
MKSCLYWNEKNEKRMKMVRGGEFDSNARKVLQPKKSSQRSKNALENCSQRTPMKFIEYRRSRKEHERFFPRFNTYSFAPTCCFSILHAVSEKKTPDSFWFFFAQVTSQF